ncbi:MAG: hypothetical protein Tsb0013_08420 [Phycisphaerales bacterium]
MLLAVCPCARAQDARVDVPFEFERETVFGQGIFVLGSLPELGAWDVRRAVKLESSAFPKWRVRVSLPAGRSYSYMYVLRDDGPGRLGDPSNAVYLTGLLTGQSPAPQAAKPQATNSVVFESDAVTPTLYMRGRGTGYPYRAFPMADIGNGRTPGEVVWAALNIPMTGEGIDFYIVDELGMSFPATGTISTPLHEVYIRDGELFGEIPPPTDSPQRLLPARTYVSDVLGESRTVRILLPRNYDTQPTKRYPVVYMHDGQNLFGDGRKWMVDEATRLQTTTGQMREVIVVAIDHAGYTSRFINYVPNGDSSNSGPGDADAYTAFIRDELKPQIDAEFRTIPDAATTGTIGSSLGAICAMYQGWAYPDTFRRVGAFSGAWPFSANFNQTLDDPTTDPGALRVYIDSGDAGQSNDNYAITSGVRDILLARDDSVGTFAIERNLRYVVGFGDEHDEYAWARRLPGALAYLYPANEGAEGLDKLNIVVRGDLNADDTVDAEDLYAFDTAPPTDIDNDGVAGTDADRAFLITLLRSGELD